MVTRISKNKSNTIRHFTAHFTGLSNKMLQPILNCGFATRHVAAQPRHTRDRTAPI
jgi:hypothetical protein